MAEPSKIYFPLRSNASALFAGPGVAGVRRRILAAGLLTDEVVLEPGLHISWAGPTGGSTMTIPARPDQPWQSARQRGRATGAQHHVGMRRSDAPESAPFRQVVATEATFSWQATFEPFRRELPRSTATWLDFGRVADDRPAQEMVKAWQSSDRIEDLQRYRSGPRPEPAGGQFVHDAILSAGYYDLAIAAITRAGVSIDRRHRLALETRVRAGDAHPIGGAYALELLLPVDFGWDDVPALQKHRAIRDYRAILREIEAEALTSASSFAELDDVIHREYERRLAAASSKGVPFAGRVALQAVGFVLGLAAETQAPLVGSAAATTAGFVAGEVLDRAVKPRWLAVDRRIKGRRNGL